MIRTISLKSGPTGATAPLIFTPGSVTLFVGPNHSGKSKVLQEIRESIPSREGTRFCEVLHSLEFNPVDDALKQGYVKSLQRECREFDLRGVPHIEVKHSGQYSKQEFERQCAESSSVEKLRNQFHPLGHNFLNRLLLLLNGNERLNLLNATQRENLREEMASVLGRLFQNDTKRKEVQRIVRDAFGWHLVTDVTGKQEFRAAVAEVEPPPDFERSLTDEALNFFASCRDIATMSDGVRAFAGMIAAVVASDARLILIDEPEAFLHPALCT
ncbi:MAG TPA: AAA family ATPase, partial [Candidatus Acidoferrum sp.]|nr:AAA family ATPase [Candidatus Acidoferrum sp.]